MFDRIALESHEEQFLAPYASKASDSGGRVHPEEEHPLRTAFQRDRDRIIHSTAFRRLEYKTQVFVNHEGDHYRTRLTHTIEVAHVALAVARSLRLNPDMTESIALAHDLGHPPFGHAGEAVLSEFLAEDGGSFEHNRQSLRIVETLESRYPDFPGLNLCERTRHGLMKHGGSGKESDPAGPNAPFLEARVVDLADSLAYSCSDLEDGLDSGLLSLDAALEVPIIAEAASELDERYPKRTFPLAQRIHQIARLVKNRLVTDLVHASDARLAQADPPLESADDASRHETRFIGYTPDVKHRMAEFTTFLWDHFYRHHRVKRMARKARMVLSRLLETFDENPDCLPEKVRDAAAGKDAGVDRKRVIVDYIAGMTDRYALQEYARMFDPIEKV